jgi:Rhodopirellula transposase DDE domain
VAAAARGRGADVGPGRDSPGGAGGRRVPGTWCRRWSAWSTRRHAGTRSRLRWTANLADALTEAGHPDATKLLITADRGGSIGARLRLWKVELAKLAEQTQLDVVVAHLPRHQQVEQRQGTGHAQPSRTVLMMSPAAVSCMAQGLG